MRRPDEEMQRITTWMVWLAAAILPPAGLVLLWMQPGTRIGRRVVDSVLMAMWGVAWLTLFFGLRFQVDGSGMRPIFSFYKPEKHYAELDRSRAQAPVATPDAEAPKVVEAAPAKAAPGRLMGAYWTDFRGPRRDGRYDEMPILTVWPKLGLKLLWRQPVGGGYASFVVASGLAFTIEQRRTQEAVAAYDLRTGREVWVHAWDGEFSESMGGDGPRATPTWHEGRIYALGAEGELRCLEAETGKRIWSRNILKDNGAANLQWGMSAAPLIVDDKVVVLPGGSGGKSVVAYNKVSGDPVWKSLDDPQGYSSPMLVTLAGGRQIVVVSARRAMGLTVESGAVLWEYPWVTQYDVNSSQPVMVGSNRVFLSAGYGHGAAMLEIAASEKGMAARELWVNTKMKNKFSTSVLHEGHLYGLDEAILACIDAETGELKWKGGRYGYGQVLLASGHLIVTSESGDVVLVKATPAKHEELGQFPAVQGKTWNNAALSNGLLLVRNTTDMACFRIAEP